MSDIQLTWRGADGSEWSLLDPTSPVQLSGGIAGLHLPDFSAQWSTTARRPGRRRRGAVLNGRNVELRVHVGDLIAPVRTGPGWRDIDAGWWASMRHDEPGTLVVDSARGERSLELWLQEAPDPVFPVDPAIAGSQEYDVVLAAEAAAWTGQPVRETFTYQPSAGENYYGGAAGLGPPFHVGSSSLSETAAISNPGDLPAFARWIITGPTESVTVGVEGAVDTLPFPLHSGDKVVIDGETQLITDGQGNNLWPQMGYATVNMAPIPKGDLVPVVVRWGGPQAGASVTVELTPLYRRAW